MRKMHLAMIGLVLWCAPGDASAFSSFKGRFMGVERFYVSCLEAQQNHPDSQSGLYEIDPDDDGPIEPFEVYCDMSTDGGGWTLIGTMADDGNNYWTWRNLWERGYIRGNAYGPPQLHRDHQSEAWGSVPADQVLLRSGGNSNKWLRYDGILSNQTMGSRYPKGLTTVGEFHVAAQRGSWRYQCGSLSLSLLRKDPDGHKTHHPWAIGFNWRSNNNHKCNYDDMYGGLNTHQAPNEELLWSGSYFYHRNFNNDALTVFVR